MTAQHPSVDRCRPVQLQRPAPGTAARQPRPAAAPPGATRRLPLRPGRGRGRPAPEPASGRGQGLGRKYFRSCFSRRTPQRSSAQRACSHREASAFGLTSGPQRPGAATHVSAASHGLTLVRSKAQSHGMFLLQLAETLASHLSQRGEGVQRGQLLKAEPMHDVRLDDQLRCARLGMHCQQVPRITCNQVDLPRSLSACGDTSSSASAARTSGPHPRLMVVNPLGLMRDEAAVSMGHG